MAEDSPRQSHLSLSCERLQRASPPDLNGEAEVLPLSPKDDCITIHGEERERHHAAGGGRRAPTPGALMDLDRGARALAHRVPSRPRNNRLR